ncbi:hypothetical protein D3C73_1391060 [compost metagenome]
MLAVPVKRELLGRFNEFIPLPGFFRFGWRQLYPCFLEQIGIVHEGWYHRGLIRSRTFIRIPIPPGVLEVILLLDAGIFLHQIEEIVDQAFFPHLQLPCGGVAQIRCFIPGNHGIQLL